MVAMKLRYWLLGILAAGVFHNAPAQKVGTSTLQFLKVMPNARAVAMGEAFVSVANGIDGVFWNPAGITGIQAHEASITHTLWIFDTKQNAIAYGLSLGDWGSVAGQFQFTDIGAIQETRADHLGFVGSGSDTRYNPGLTGRTFTPMSWVLGLTYARSFTDRFSAGITGKFVYESLYNSNTAVVVVDSASRTFNTYTSAVLFDFGMRYNTGFRSIVIGASVQNFGSQIKFAEDRFSAPLVFRLGISSSLLGENALLFNDPNNRLTLSYDILQPNDYDQQMHIGMEYEFASMLSLRGGYKVNYDADRWTFGGGARRNFAGFLLSFDYSYGEMGTYLGQVHRVSLGVNVQ